jgi:hypothetical protein
LAPTSPQVSPEQPASPTVAAPAPSPVNICFSVAG